MSDREEEDGDTTCLLCEKTFRATTRASRVCKECTTVFSRANCVVCGDALPFVFWICECHLHCCSTCSAKMGGKCWRGHQMKREAALGRTVMTECTRLLTGVADAGAGASGADVPVFQFGPHPPEE
jgi:hypothetical protein